MRTGPILKSQAEFAFKRTICGQLSLTKETEKTLVMPCAQYKYNCKDPICYSQLN